MSKTTKTSGKRIVFFGNERVATSVVTTAPTLQALISDGYDVAAVVSNYEPGRSRNARTLEIEKAAEEHGIPLLLPNSPADILDQLRDYKADIGVLVAYGRIVPQSVIDAFPKGIVNIHPSLLPKHRGSTPIESVIMNGEQKTGVSLMSLAKAMDAGPVYAQSEIELNGDESKQQLADELLDIGATMLVELLPGILDGNIVAIPQDESRATYDSLLSKDNGIIDWSKPASMLEREVRAFHGWPRSRTELGGKDVIITKAHSLNSGSSAAPGIAKANKEAGLITVSTSDGLLCIERLIPAGKGEMSAEAFIAGYGRLLEG